MPTLRHLLLILFVCLATIFGKLGVPRLWDRDEPRNARCAVEMLARHDWVVPMFNDELRTHKPVLLYWLMMVAYQVFGVNEFAARFSSAVLGTGTVLITYAIATRLFHRSAALWASVVLASTLMFCVAARAATPDAALIFFSTCALAVYVYAVPRRCFSVEAGMGESDADRACYFPSRPPALLALYGVMGLAVLDKGPVGLIVPTAIVGMFLLVVWLPRRRVDSEIGWLLVPARVFAPRHFLRTCRRMRPVWALAAALAVALPWYVWVGVRSDGKWLSGFLFDHNLGRALQPLEGHHGSVFYYPIAILMGFFPWSILAVPVALYVRECLTRSQRSRPKTSCRCSLSPSPDLSHAIPAARGGGEDRNEQLVFGQEQNGLLENRPDTTFSSSDAMQCGADNAPVATLVSLPSPGIVFLLCWIGVPVLLFSLARTKLPSYVTPTYPALAILCGSFLHDWVGGKCDWSRRWLLLAAGCWVLIGTALAVGLPWAASEFLPGEEWLGWLGAIPILGGVTTFYWIRRAARFEMAYSLGVTSVLFVAAVFGLVATQVSRHQQYDRLLAAGDSGRSISKWASFGCLEPSWVFYAGRPICLFQHDRRDHAVRFMYQHADGGLIAAERDWDSLRPQLPEDVFVASRAKYFLKDQTLVVVRRRTPAAFDPHGTPTPRTAGGRRHMR